jgi:hypothetical protein
LEPDSYTLEYLSLIQETIDPEARVDSDGNVVYVDDVDMEIITVSPEACKKHLNSMMEG